VREILKETLDAKTEFGLTFLRESFFQLIAEKTTANFDVTNGLANGRDSLLLLILRLILLIWEIFGLFKIHKWHLGTRDKYFSVCICSPSCCLPIPSYLRL
jgi:hypothetical protein